MQLCMNDVTIMKHGDLLSRIAAVGQAGYPAMEFRKAALLSALRSDVRTADIRKALDASGVEISCLNAEESISFNGKRGSRVLGEAAEYLFYLCSELGCPCVEVIGSFKAPTEDADEIKKETAEALLRLSDIAKPYGIRLAIEFMALPGSSVRTLEQSLEILDIVNRDNVGVLFDTWHHFAGGGTAEDILKAGSGRIFMVHVSDCPEGTPFEIPRTESFFPGDGAVPIAEHLAAIRETGYDGAVSLEIMAPEVQEMRTVDCLAKGCETLLPLFP